MMQIPPEFLPDPNEEENFFEEEEFEPPPPERPRVKITVKYNPTTAFVVKYEEMKEYITDSLKEVDFEWEQKQGPIRTFEVKINDKLVHSKYKTNAFPDYDDLIMLIIRIGIREEPHTDSTICGIDRPMYCTIS